MIIFAWVLFIVSSLIWTTFLYIRIFKADVAFSIFDVSLPSAVFALLVFLFTGIILLHWMAI